MTEQRISIALESISTKGCDYVREALQIIANGNLPVELTGYSSVEIQKVWQELSSIIDVYENNSAI